MGRFRDKKFQEKHVIIDINIVQSHIQDVVLKRTFESIMIDNKNQIM